MYGGHVHDTWDLEAMESAAKVFLGRELPLWFSEDNIVAQIISTSGSLGNYFF